MISDRYFGSNNSTSHSLWLNIELLNSNEREVVMTSPKFLLVLSIDPVQPKRSIFFALVQQLGAHMVCPAWNHGCSWWGPKLEYLRGGCRYLQSVGDI